MPWLGGNSIPSTCFVYFISEREKEGERERERERERQRERGTETERETEREIEWARLPVDYGPVTPDRVNLGSI